MSDRKFTRTTVKQHPELKAEVQKYNPFTDKQYNIKPSLDRSIDNASFQSASSDTSSNLDQTIRSENRTLDNSGDSESTKGESNPNPRFKGPPTSELDLESPKRSSTPVNGEPVSNSTVIALGITEDELQSILDIAVDALNDEMAISLKDALRVVPEYNGKNIPLSIFFEGCDEAREMVGAANEANLTKLLRSKLSGEARGVIQGQSFDTIVKLKDQLKMIYSPIKSVHQLLGELGNEFQQDEESVIAYANRIRDLQDRIIEAQTMNGGTADDAFKAALKPNLIECFKKGLKPDIENKLEDAEDLSNLVKNAIFAERSLEARKVLRERAFPKLEQSNKGRDNKKNVFKCQTCKSDEHETSQCRSGNPLHNTCRRCQRIGHSAENCNVRLPQPHRVSPTCMLCNHPGHTADQCRKQLKCQWCDGQGHSADQCFKRLSLNNQTLSVCQTSGKPGHIASQCRSSGALKCQLCDHVGHTAIQCATRTQNRTLCQLCLKPGHNAVNCHLRHSNPKFIARSHLSCQNCDGTGHTAATCIIKPRQGPMTKICAYCKNKGHNIAECRKRMYNENSGNGQGTSRPSATGESPNQQQQRSINVVQTNEILSELLPFD